MALLSIETKEVEGDEDVGPDPGHEIRISHARMLLDLRC